MHRCALSARRLSMILGLALSGCAVTPDGGDSTAPELLVFEDGRQNAIAATSGTGLPVTPRTCSELGEAQGSGWELRPYHLVPVEPLDQYELAVVASDLGGVARIEVAFEGDQSSTTGIAPPGAVVEVRDLGEGGVASPFTFVIADFSEDAPPRTVRELRFGLGDALDLARLFGQQPLPFLVSATDFNDNSRAWSVTIGGSRQICR